MLTLVGEPGLADRVRTLAARETECCSFFAFSVTEDGGEVRLGITVPPAYADVLAALARRAADRRST